MKHLMISALLLVSVAVFAQNFEGTITWSVKMEITDQAAKARVEEARKRMDDPATKAKMQGQANEYQAKMKDDPKFREMMENNPQMKAQMEKAMSKMQHGDVNSLFPTGMLMKIKDQHMITQMQGGLMENEFLHRKGEEKTYMLDHANKTFSVVNGAEIQEKEPEVKVTLTNEKGKVLEYSCSKYIVESVQNGRALTHTIWTTTEIKDIDMKAMSAHTVGNRNSFYYEGVEGVPLKMEMATPEGRMIMETTEIKRSVLPASVFTLPAGYKEVPMMR